MMPFGEVSERYEVRQRGCMYRIYIIEDDSIIAEQIKEHMTNWGFEGQMRIGFQKYNGGICRV